MPKTTATLLPGRPTDVPEPHSPPTWAVSASRGRWPARKRLAPRISNKGRCIFCDREAIVFACSTRSDSVSLVARIELESGRFTYRSIEGKTAHLVCLAAHFNAEEVA
ncbi:MAG: hypothetical protein ACREEC_07750 [Thermoplasmata archaeon]